MVDIEVTTTPIYDATVAASIDPRPYVFSRGGAGSSKTISYVQFFIFLRCLAEFPFPYRLLLMRKFRVWAKASVWEILCQKLEEYQVPIVKNNSDLVITFLETGAMIRVGGLEDRESIKTTEWHDIWMSEASDFDLEDFIFLQTRLYRGVIPTAGFIPKIWCDFNPIDCWCKEREEAKDVVVIKSTYRDNPFVNPAAAQRMVELQAQNENYYQIYALGNYGALIGAIFNRDKHWVIYNSPWPTSYDDKFYGLDFGFNNPTALLEIIMKDGVPYERELIYAGMNTQDLLVRLRDLGISKRDPIYGDSEDPGAIDTIFGAGYNILPAEKGQGSVKASIDYCQTIRAAVHPDSMNLVKEYRFYSWRTDKNGRPMDEPVKINDHLMSAKRYAYYTHRNKAEPGIIFTGKGKK